MHYVGIDVASNRPCNLVIIDAELRFVEARWSSDRLAAATHLSRSYPDAIVAVDAPRRLNQGLMAEDAFREGLDVPPKPDKHRNCRVCEYQLSRRNVPLYFTPHENPPAWMQVGFRWYEALVKAGYGDYPLGEVHGPPCVIEYYPHASFVGLLGGIPPDKATYEGRKARVELLRRLDSGCDFGVSTADMIDAMVGAVTAARLHHGLAVDYGETTEGLMTVAAELPDGARPLEDTGAAEQASEG